MGKKLAAFFQIGNQNMLTQVKLLILVTKLYTLKVDFFLNVNLLKMYSSKETKTD